MTTDLPDPHGCPHCGHAGLAERWGETICGMCGAPRVHATPGCPVRNAVSNAIDEMVGQGKFHCDVFRQVIRGQFVHAESVTAETARERRVHDGGPRITQ